MGSLVYALWWLANRPGTFQHDWIIFSLLLSLDSQTWFRLWLWRCSRR